MEIPGFTCARTGTCCRRKRVPLTLVDVDHMAAYLGMSPREPLISYVQEAGPSEEAMLLLRKDAEGLCLLNADGTHCTIHPAKPAACALYICDTSLKSANGYPWSLMFNNPEGLSFIVERSIAEEATKPYVEKNGAAWNAASYREAVEEAKRRIEQSKRHTLKAARLPDGSATFISFDCPSCPLRTSCCKDRPLTLDDIRIIADHRGMTPGAFFAAKVSPTLREKAQGALSLKRSEDGHCVFLDAKIGRCAVQNVQPMCCRAMPCPGIAMDGDTADRYFLGSGTLGEQFRHSVALAATRRYVTEYGASYNKQGIEKHLTLLDRVASEPARFEDFRRFIAPYRYEDEQGTV